MMARRGEGGRPESSSAGRSRARALQPTLPVRTVAISGAVVLVVEILGSRLVSPFFGSSLNVWSSIIATTLLALAAGYALGGAAGL